VYRRYLLVERGLAEHTVRDAYVPAARLFLAGRERPEGLALERLSAAHVSLFLSRSARSAVCRARGISRARCGRFLRFLHVPD